MTASSVSCGTDSITWLSASQRPLALVVSRALEAEPSPPQCSLGPSASASSPAYPRALSCAATVQEGLPGPRRYTRCSAGIRPSDRRRLNKVRNRRVGGVSTYGRTACAKLP